MGTLNVTDRDGHLDSVSFENGDKLMEVLKAQDMVRGECGGMQICSTCHVLLSPAAYGAAGPATDMEEDLIDGTGEYKAGASRLSCLITLTDDHDGMELQLAPDL